MDTDQPRERLLRDHAVIEVLLQELLAAFDSGDREIATRAFLAFDHRLAAHLELEEEMLLPVLVEIDREAADAIAAEHRRIRARIDELAVADNLHISRASEVRRLVDMLRAHARYEDQTLYRLADRLADQPALRDRLTAAEFAV